MATITEKREIKTKPIDAVLAVATISAEMGYLGFEPYDQTTVTERGEYHITLYFKKRDERREASPGT